MGWVESEVSSDCFIHFWIWKCFNTQWANDHTSWLYWMSLNCTLQILNFMLCESHPIKNTHTHTHIPFSFIRLENNKMTINLCGSAGKESAYNVGDLSSIPRLGRFSGEGKGYPLQYSGLENFTDCIVHRVAKSRTRQNNFHFHFYNLILSRNFISSRGCQNTATRMLIVDICMIWRTRNTLKCPSFHKL